MAIQNDRERRCIQRYIWHIVRVLHAFPPLSRCDATQTDAKTFPTCWSPSTEEKSRVAILAWWYDCTPVRSKSVGFVDMTITLQALRSLL